MARYAQLLFNHFLQLENLNSTFDRVFPLLEELSSEESKGFYTCFLILVVNCQNGQQSLRYVGSLEEVGSESKSHPLLPLPDEHYSRQNHRRTRSQFPDLKPAPKPAL